MPVFERSDKDELEAEAEKLWQSVKSDADVVAKVVKGKDKPEPETSAAEVETK